MQNEGAFTNMNAYHNVNTTKTTFDAMPKISYM